MLLWFVVPVLRRHLPRQREPDEPGQVTPTSGTTATNFTFSVTYQDNAGEAPDLDPRVLQRRDDRIAG